MLAGGSGGGPYALACARYISPDDGLRAVAVLAGIGPWECTLKDVNWNTKLTLYMSKYTPSVLKWLSRFALPVPKVAPSGPLEELKADPEAEASVLDKLGAYINALSPRDQGALNKPETKECLAATLVESVIQGLDGYMYEAGLYTKEWDFKLEDIKFSRPLVLWYGTEDKNATIHMGRHLARRIHGADLREVEGETHFTMCAKIVEYFDELLKLGEIQATQVGGLA